MHPDPQFDIAQFAVHPKSELSPEVLGKRWRGVQAILRMATITGSQMQLGPALNLICDLAGMIVSFDSACVYFWNEPQEKTELRLRRGHVDERPQVPWGGNLLHFWVTQNAVPLLIESGKYAESDAELKAAGARSALVLPLFVKGRVLGSLQLFCEKSDGFNDDDAQLLWTLVLVSENLLTREQANEGLLRFAFTDYLTSLRTRGYFEQQLDLEVKRSDRKQEQFSLLMVDIDHFKALNDTYGHHVGDVVLRQVTALLVKDMREVDTVARYGGEEFVIILPEASEQEAISVAQRLRKAVQNSNFQIEGTNGDEKLTISIGIAVYGRDARCRQQLIEYADAALYAAKSRGRNQVLTYSQLQAEERKEVS
ncbi:MAG TPA: sensor domain-containing diguanylate cyclase [Terriglobales bacterium]|jgi:diguanylate cyclase (GGDEF)-like protein|nr:sensor domain-containing diguanylate cyclase [Terriglobales bacterium]